MNRLICWSVQIINAIFLCDYTCCFPTLLGVRGSQPDTNPVFVDLKAQAAVFVIVGLLAQLREFGCIGQQPFLQLGIVGVDLCGGSFAL